MDPTVQVAMVTTLGGIFIAYLSRAGISRRQKHHDEQLKVIRHEVKNSHETNLREDIDKVLTGLTEVHTAVSNQSNDIRQLREDLAVERRERLAVSDRLDDLIEHVA